MATFRPYKRRVAWVALAIVVTSGLGVVNPLMIAKIFDEALFGFPVGDCGGPCPNLPLLYVYVGIMVAVPIVTSVIGIGQTYLANLVGLRVMQDLRNSLYSHLQFMPLRFFTTTRTGEIQSRLANDVGGVQSVVTDTASNVLSNVVTIVSTLIAMTLLSVPLTVLSLALMPLFLWLTVKVGRARRVVASSTQRTLRYVADFANETVLLMAPRTCGELPVKSTVRSSSWTVTVTLIGIASSVKPSPSMWSVKVKPPFGQPRMAFRVSRSA